MSMDAELRRLDLDQDVIYRLSQHLNRTYEGSDEVYRTPFGKDHSPDFLLRELDKVFNTNKDRLNTTLIELELSNRAKFGPRSTAKPWPERKQSLSESFENTDHDKDFTLVTTFDKNNRLRPLSNVSALKLLKNNTNSGLPYYTKKGKVKDRVLDKYDLLLKRKDPCILFTRTQEQGKTRNVWGYPMVDTLNEMRYYSPLLSYQKALPYRAALVSPDEVGRRLTGLINRAVKSEMILVSIDFASYDTSVKSKLQRLAFDYIKSLFQPSYYKELDYINDRFTNIGILTPDGVMSGSHGIPSGSTFTNEVDSIVQTIISRSLDFISEDDFQVQGDDGVYLVSKEFVEKLFSAFNSCGLNVNKDKSYESGNFAVYLQNLYHVDYEVNGFIGGIYPIYRALNRIIYQERWSDFEDFGISGKDYYSIRTICIVENCKHHPLFEKFVSFILKYDKYSLDYTDQGLLNYVQMVKNAYGVGGLLNNQYGDDVSGIANFETVKLIKRMS